MNKLTHIELFAGCGGMSLGLESAGFDLIFANELSPMAGETFAYNILNEDLNNLSEIYEHANKTLWIKSCFEASDLKNRLRENPFEASKGKYSDLNSETDLIGKLLIGDVDNLLEYFDKNVEIVNALRNKNIDLMSGGPPCQSFSLVGKREKHNVKNILPLSFSKFAGLIKPKAVLLENVKGITVPFAEGDSKYYAWLEVSKSFVLEGYVPVCMMLNSKYFGVPQNRPRFVLLAYRKDIFKKMHDRNKDNKILELSNKFYSLVILNKETLDKVTIKDFKYYDIETNPELFDGKSLPKIVNCKKEFISTSDAIGDIICVDSKYRISETKGEFANSLNEIFQKKSYFNNYLIKNHESRNHSFIVKSRFRFYQDIELFKNGLKKGAVDLLTGNDVSEELCAKLKKEFLQYELLFWEKGNEVSRSPKNIEEVEELIKSIPTRKHSQRALKKNEPANSQLTIPDDLCHYDPSQTRTLTVREMARFQTFPDWFEFRSKVTTGGKMRKFEVPQYTQVGNAVPPLLAKCLGETIKNQLENININN